MGDVEYDLENIVNKSRVERLVKPIVFALALGVLGYAAFQSGRAYEESPTQIEYEQTPEVTHDFHGKILEYDDKKCFEKREYKLECTPTEPLYKLAGEKLL